MRRLSEKQARQCENALTKRCRCRCGGALHGANRNRKEDVEPELSSADGTAAREFFEGLPGDDPHRIRTEEEKEERQRAAANLRETRAVLAKLKHDRDRLLELGSSALAARLEQDIREQQKRLEWLRGRAHGS